MREDIVAMNRRLERENLEIAVQQQYGQIIGIEQASDEHLRRLLASGGRKITHHYHESKSAPSLFGQMFWWL